MKFTKMHGCGNDYVYVNCFVEQVADAPYLSRVVSDRHFGIGSDGLILIKPSEKADFTMDMYNADGSNSQMCGNGIRCVAKYVYDYGLTDKKNITVESGGSVKYLDLNVTDGKVTEVTVNMGTPITKPGLIPVISDKKQVIAEPLLIDGNTYEITCVSMGNPHAVVFVEDTKAVEIEKIGPLFEHNEIFPERTNTEFIHVIDRKTIDMRVWERGSGETLACGTGACASVYACILNGYTEDTVTVRLLGGELKIQYDREKHTIFMTGPAVTVFDGELNVN
ncbi:diaminopimelate epimerase [Anaerocolumna cellulosilytica]|uniref:Diaminopimelate epimerase n=1 Tax=Anaerocolumna cellulosilytica TaxID=433286 RepID=A0A6S6R0N1_9FIRM|nr:diaminopimelate epimerase [Anaerocolumna cellulosilytica]MBB5196069.1 diaminopimelate epimerase [Anaerocolumna cellulosilytica]BCJ93627.1 diaminopimelate epimerase [Anaerocolumna cellulosilytica]